MSRSALVTIRWSNTKLPLSEPATTRSEGSQWRRSASAKISSSGALAPRARHAHRHPQPQRVEVAVERVGLAPGGPAAAGAGRLRRTPRARPAGCRSRWGESSGSSTGSCSTGTGTAPQSPRSRRSGSAFPTSAGGRSRSRRRGSAPPGAVPATACGWSMVSPAVGSRRSRPASTVSRPRCSPRRCGDQRVGAVALRDAEHGGRAEAPVDHRRDQHRQRRRSPAGGGACGRCRSAGSPRRRASCAPGRPSAAPPGARAPRGRQPTVDVGVLGGDQHEARQLERVGVGREDGQRLAVGGPPGRPRRRRRARARSAGWRARPRPRSALAARPGAGRSPARRR